MIPDHIFEHFLTFHLVTTDTRKVQPNAIYVALKGANFDGNTFVKQALEAGCTYAISSDPSYQNHPNILIVNDTLEALQALALRYRRTFNIPIVAITGSNGKTTTKELVRDVLSKKFKVHATPGNLNNHIGIPLTLLSMPSDTELAIIEMGANHQKEIASYCLFTEPTHGLITNIGKAHLEGFGGLEGVKKGKKELYDYLHTHRATIFANTDQPELAEVSAQLHVEAYGLHQKDFTLEVVNESPTLHARLSIGGERLEMPTHLSGTYNLYNIASAVKVGISFGVDARAIVEAISAYQPENNRSQLRTTEHNVLIMDAYNANPTSMEHALINLSKQDHLHKFFIIGDMLELGDEGPAEHERILKLAQTLQLKGIAIGPVFYSLSTNFGFTFFPSTSQALDALQTSPLHGRMILIKGSRGMKLEDLVPAL